MNKKHILVLAKDKGQFLHRKDRKMKKRLKLFCFGKWKKASNFGRKIQPFLGKVFSIHISLFPKTKRSPVSSRFTRTNRKSHLEKTNFLFHCCIFLFFLMLLSPFQVENVDKSRKQGPAKLERSCRKRLSVNAFSKIETRAEANFPFSLSCLEQAPKTKWLFQKKRRSGPCNLSKTEKSRCQNEKNKKCSEVVSKKEKSLVF